MTGCDDATEIVHGHRGVAALGTRLTWPRPPMQISAMRKPAEIPPRCVAPASISVSPSKPSTTPTFSAVAS